MSARQELGRLEASGLIQIAALQPELAYLFRHALVQEAAYASLLKQDRRALHKAAAEAILTLHPDRQREFAPVVAMHLEQAGESARAAEYLVIAGEHALERFANKEAVAFFQRAIELVGDSQSDFRLRAAIGAAKAGWTFTATGREVADLEGAVAAGEQGDPRLLIDALFWIAYMRRQRGELAEASPELKRALERAVEIGGSLKGSSGSALPRALIGSYAAFLGNLRDGATQMRSALDDLEEQADPLSSAMIADFLAMTYARMGDFKEADEIVAFGQRYAARGDEIARVDIDIAQSAIDLERGDLEKATAQALSCSARAEDLGAFACVVASNVMLGSATLANDDAMSAKPPLERGDELCMVTNMAPFRTLTKGLLASTRAQLGDLPAGVVGWNEALESARGMQDRYGEARVLWARGRSYARQVTPDWNASLADLDQATKLFETMEARPSLARALFDRSKALRGLGRTSEAGEVENQGLQLGRRLGLKDAPFA